MRLYLVRHGKAEPKSTSGLDVDRELALRGREQAAWLGQYLARAEQIPTQILTSSAVRARQTAEILAAQVPAFASEREKETRSDKRIEICEALGLQTTCSKVVAMLASLPTDGAIVCVGHNPTLSNLTTLLTQGLGNQSSVTLKTGQMMILECERPQDLIGTCRFLGAERCDTVPSRG